MEKLGNNVSPAVQLMSTVVATDDLVEREAHTSSHEIT